jgi:hypothetical protein
VEQFGIIAAELSPADLASLPENTTLMAEVIGRFSTRVDAPGEHAKEDSCFCLRRAVFLWLQWSLWARDRLGTRT